MTWAAVERRLRGAAILRWMEMRRVRRDRCMQAPRTAHDNSQRSLYVDVSVISRHDAGTGIQRLVREVAGHLLAAPPAGWCVIPVGAAHKRPYCRIDWPGKVSHSDTREIEARSGDVFLGLDFALDTIHRHEHQLAAFKRQGGRLWFVMYDLLPMQRPEWFSDKLVVRFQKWLRVLASLADGFYCISPPVEQDLRHTLAQRYLINDGVHTRVIPMGWDLVAPSQETIQSDHIVPVIQAMQKAPSALMVGTLEPRKGHSDVLTAFDLLWQRNTELNLVIVGRPGWKTEELQATLRQHPQSGKRLFWLDDADDSALTALYDACKGVIMASHAEGFGLPLLEALGRGKSVLARDIPIFRLHEKWGLQYFPQEAQSVELAKLIATWLSAADRQTTKPIGNLPTWRDTARAIWLPVIEKGC